MSLQSKRDYLRQIRSRVFYFESTRGLTILAGLLLPALAKAKVKDGHSSIVKLSTLGFNQPAGDPLAKWDTK
ncbi:MAG: hypothetical protein ABJC04_03440 [Verrucomicrobiota bacterium]